MVRTSLGRMLRVLAVLLLLVLVTACDPAADPGDSAGGAVKNPDRLVVTTDDEPPTLDPAGVEPTGLSATAMMIGYDQLLTVAPNSTELAPAISTEVPSLDNGGISADGLTYTFPIREGVKFHDGSELTAGDVKYSWERVVTMNLPEGEADIFSNIREIRVVDDHRLQVVLKEVQASFLYSVVASMSASIVNMDVVEANGGVTANQPSEFLAANMAGSGPYVLKEWQRGERLTFDVFQDYWGDRAKLPLEWHNVQDPNVATLGLRAGDYDIIEGVPSIVADVQGASGVKVVTDIPGGQLLEVGFNMNIDTSKLPDSDDIPADFFHDPRVRQAFNYAFNYDAFIKGQLAGAATRGSFHLPKGLYGHDPAAPVYPYDPAKAEELLRAAGWWDKGFTVSIIAEEDTAFSGAALLLKDGLESINPKFHVNAMALPEARFDELMAQDPIPVAMWSWTSPAFADPHSYMMNSVHPEGRWGARAGFAKGYSDPDRIARMVEDANRELNPDERAKQYAELQRVLYEEAMWLLPAQEALVLANRDWLEGVVANAMWPRPGLKYSLYGKRKGSS
jgi:peptide/nickel transport system substrate-binding protein